MGVVERVENDGEAGDPARMEQAAIQETGGGDHRREPEQDVHVHEPR